MRRLVTIAVLVILFGTAAMASMSAEPAPARRLIVQVHNGTSGGAAVTGDPVTVQLYRGQTPAGAREAVVDEQGKAVFDGLPLAPNMTVVPRARHQNMAFGGRPVTVTAAGGDVTAAVTVFDVSTDAAALSTGIHHIIIGLQSTALEVTEYFQLNNGSDRAIIGSARDAQNRPKVIEIGLPEGFRNLRALDYFEQNALVPTSTGFYDTMAVPPGEHQVTFSYQVPVERAPVNFVRTISLPTSELLIFWKGGQGTLEGLGEPAGRMTNADGVAMTYYRRENLAGAEKVSFRVAGINAPSSDTRMWIVLGIVFAAVAVIAIVRLRSGSPQSEPSS